MRGKILGPFVACYVLAALFLPRQVYGAAQPNTRSQLLSILPRTAELKTIVQSREPEFYSRENIARYLEGERKNIVLEYGFSDLLVTAYFKAGEVITVEIYKMATPQGAYGFYNNTRIPKELKFKLGDGSKMSASTLIFWQVTYVVKLISLGRSPEGTNAMKQIANIISARISGRSSSPVSVKIVPAKDMVEGSLRYALGPIVLGSYFRFIPEGILDKRDNIGEAVVAEYKGKSAFTYCLLRYASNWRSQSVLGAILEKLKQNSTEHYYLFDVALYKAGNYYYKIDRIENYISILRFTDKDFKYEWYLDHVRRKITG